VFIATLVWLGYLAARLVFPENKFVRLGVPALIAFMPQTAFYSIQNDVLLPLTFGAAFILLMKFSRAEVPGVKLGMLTGLALAAAFLTKASSLPLLAVSALFVLWKMFRLARAGKSRAAWPALASLALCASTPMAGWLIWCQHNFGDLTGTAAKIQFLGWTHQPFAEWRHHPIFTPQGFWTFASGLLSTFWQGEFTWHRRPLALPAAAFVYIVSTIVFVGAVLLNLLRKSGTPTGPQRDSLYFSFACCIAAVAFLGFLSVIYNFHDCVYPSRAHPYFTSGRLMIGALIPFMLLYVSGIDRVLHRVKNHWLRPLVLVALILFMLISETTVDWAIFPDPYNWFHL
jgi:hypothetical protein